MCLLMKRLYIALALLQLSLFGHAQVPSGLSSSEIYQGLKKLNVLGSVLYVAAHPDDENTRLLAYLSKERLYRTGYLSLTRGDGGQNLIGDEQGVELGLIRTQELLAARRVDGAEQFFSRAYDFGYSKTADETLRIWGKEKILNDIVWVIRRFQPDVIITRFPADSRAGHGHHWSSALLANEAFKLAADPNAFPEHFKHGVGPWQARRILWNAFIFGSNNVPDTTFKLDVGTFNTMLGKGYGEIASESRSNHKSQGFGAARTRGQAFEYFITTGGDKPATDIMDEVNTGWERVGQPAIAQQITKIIDNYNFGNPQSSLKELVALYRSIRALPSGYWRNQKLGELQQLIVSTAGLFADANATSPTAIPGDSLRVNFVVNKRNNADVVLKAIQMDAYSNKLDSTLPFNRNIQFNHVLPVPQDKPVSQPYWLAHSEPNGSFDVRDQLLVGRAENTPAFEVMYTLQIAGENFDIKRPVQYKYTDPVKGEVYQPVAVLPRIEVKMDREAYVSVNGKAIPAAVRFKPNMPTRNGFAVAPKISASWKASDKAVNYNENTREQQVVFTAGDKSTNSNDALVLVNASDSSRTGFTRTISYDHIPTITYFPPAKARLVNVELKTVGKKVGYIAGAGDKVPEALEQMGYEVVMLSKDDINAGNLESLQAVVTGIRAYNVHSYLSDKYEVLMDYVKNGGNLIVQFNTNNQVGPVRSKISPHPFNISRTRVSEEDAAVSFSLPGHPSLNYPNKITQNDFAGWVQERSVYEAAQLHPAYATPLSMSDKGEKPGNGSLIIAAHGKGNFIYTGLSFFRQLPAGVPGAYRLLANLVATPRND